MLLTYVWKWIVSLIGGLSLLTISLSFAARIPDNFVCIELYDLSTSSPDNLYLFDTSRGFDQHDTRNGAVGNGGVYSPNNTFYAYVESKREYKKATSSLYVYSVETHTSIPLETDIFPSYSNFGMVSYVLWSSDSQRIAYLWTDMGRQVHLSIANADGTSKQTVDISEGDVKPFTINNLLLSTWSADGKYLSVAKRGKGDTGFWFWSTQPLQRLPYELDNRELTRGVWSPDGHTFAGVIPGDKPELVLFKPGEPFSIIKSDLPSGSYEQVSWSPDGHYLMAEAITENCAEANCSPYWRHALFDAERKRLISSFLGNQAESSGDASYIAGPGGSITLTGHTLSAMWRPEGHSWIFVRENHSGQTKSADLVALDALRGKYEILAHNLVTDYINNMFYSLTQYITTPISFDAIPMVPSQFHNIIIPRWEDSKITIELANLDMNARIIVVRGADELIQPTSGAFWMSSKLAFVIWATGQGDDRHVRLSAVNPESGVSQAMPLDFQNIGQLTWIAPSWSVFVGERENVVNVYAFNLQTGAYREIIHDLTSMSSQWTVSIDQQEQIVAAGYYPRTDTKSHTLLVPLNDGEGEVREIVSDGLNRGAWSPDKLDFAFITGGTSVPRTLRIVTQDGTSVQDTVLYTPLSTQPWISRWTKCYA